jgi:small subunit ribosomal protein S4
LQTIVFKKGLARSAKQARQFIGHEHILVDGKKINAPGYLVTKDEESKITFTSSSALFSESHPERATEEKAPKPKKQPQQPAEDEKPEVVELDEEDKDLE